jgi:CBS-domain-containing membrane protein
VSALSQWLGVELDEVSLKEKLISAVGGFVAILGVLAVSELALGLEGAEMLIGSMGASAVLLFAVPHGPLSQPWAALAGHLVSAFIGVTCAMLVSPTELAAALAVALAIGVMHLCRCIHPPGGATAITAVIGGSAVTDLGYAFVWRPVMLNALTIALVAVLFNALFPWRRYPAHLVRRRRIAMATVGEPGLPSHEEVVAALRSLDSFIDVSEDDLVHLYRILSAPPRT